VHGTIGSGELRRRPEVEGEIVDVAVVRGAVPRLQGLSDAEVQRRSPRSLQSVGDGTAQQLVPEAVRDPRAWHLHDHVTSRRLVERDDERVLGLPRGGAEHRELHLATADGHELEDLARRRRQAGEARPDDLANALRDTDGIERAGGRSRVPGSEHPGVGEVLRQLAHQERIAARELRQRPGEPRHLVVTGSRGDRPEAIGDLGRAQGRDAYADDAVVTPQVGKGVGEVGGALGFHVAERGEDEQAQVCSGSGQVAQQQERRRIGPVEVVEHEHDRGPAGVSCERFRDRDVEPVAPPAGCRRQRRRGVGGLARLVRQQLRELVATRAACDLRDDRGIALGELLQRLDEGLIGRGKRRVAASVEDPGARLRGALRELTGEPCLAGSGLALHERDAPPVPHDLRPQLGEDRHLLGAPDERQRAREPKRPRKARLRRGGHCVPAPNHSPIALLATRPRCTDRPANWARSRHDGLSGRA